MVFLNLKTGRYVSTENPDTIEIMKRSDSYKAFEPTPKPKPAKKPAKQKQ